jgi:hypothetical protein
LILVALVVVMNAVRCVVSELVLGII